MKKPLLFILSGPSGAGKTTLLDRLFRKKFFREHFLLAVSCTTRKKRPGEKEGRDYFFIDKKTFLRRKREGFFLETQKVVEEYYGTPAFFLQQARKEGKGLVLCIDVKGGRYVQRRVKDAHIISIFVSAPDRNELQARLKKRKEAPSVIRKRIDLAKKELHYLKYYGYLIINKNLSESVQDLEAVLRGERVRRR